jgi:tetratricopeptide (TPR) repeat protein
MLRLCFACLLILGFVGCDSPELPDASFEGNERLDSLMQQIQDDRGVVEFDESIANLNEIMALSEESGEPDYLIRAYNITGTVYSTYNLYDEALENYFKALEISKEERIDRYLNSIFNNIGISYSRNGSFEKGGDYFNKALEISRKRGDSLRVALNLVNLSNTLEERQLSDSSLACLEQALELYQALNQEMGYIAVLANIGSSYSTFGKADSAFKYLNKAYIGAKQKENVYIKSAAAVGLAKLYLDEAQIDSTEFYLREAMQGFSMLNDKQDLLSAKKLQASLFSLKGDPAEAIAVLEEITDLQDSLISVQTTQWISKHQLNYEYGQKEKELELLEEKARREKILWIAGIAIAVFISLLVIQLLRSRLERVNQKNLLLKKKKELGDLELEKAKLSQKREKEEQEARMKISEIEKEKLQQELDFKNRAMVSNVINIANQNEKMNTVLSLLKKAESSSQEEAEALLKESKSIIYSQQTLEKEWETFRIHFEEVHPNFFTKLSAQSSSLTSNDLRMCAYALLDLSPKEIALILNIAPSSIRKRKQRLKVKLNIDNNEDLSDWLRKTILD